MEAIEGDPSGIYEIWISQDRHSDRLKEIVNLAGKKNIPCLRKQKEIIDHILPGVNHQGIVALSREFRYTELSNLINLIKKIDKHGLIIALDHITDEGNLGAIIRTCVFFNAQGLILPKDRSARITQNVIKRSSGACFHIPIVSVVNLGRTLETLDNNGFWIIGTAGDSTVSIYEFDWKRDLILVLGNEEKGLSPGIKKRCHEIISIPQTGGFGALNVSVACGVALSEILRQRSNIGKT
jgi:23S rRNA (guanosine2251-2'-O)-methyltransferase